MRRTPVKYSKWYQPPEPDPETPNPIIVIVTLLGMLLCVFGILVLVA